MCGEVFVFILIAFLASANVTDAAAIETTDATRTGNRLDLKLVNKLIEGTAKSWPPHHSTDLDSITLAKTHTTRIHASPCCVKKTAFSSAVVPPILQTFPSSSLVRLSLPSNMLVRDAFCFHPIASLCLKGTRSRAVEVAAQSLRVAASGQAKESEREVLEATFALGNPCIIQDEYDRANFPGILNTTVGYTGGENESPTYDTVSRGDGHKEALKIEFDPNKTSYKELLDFFWEQYQESGTKNRLAKFNKAIWYHNEEQRKAIEDSISQYTACTGLNPEVTVQSAAKWYVAEWHQQKSVARKRKVMGGAGSLMERAGDARMQDSR